MPSIGLSRLHQQRFGNTNAPVAKTSKPYPPAFYKHVPDGFVIDYAKPDDIKAVSVMRMKQPNHYGFAFRPAVVATAVDVVTVDNPKTNEEELVLTSGQYDADRAMLGPKYKGTITMVGGMIGDLSANGMGEQAALQELEEEAALAPNTEALPGTRMPGMKKLAGQLSASPGSLREEYQVFYFPHAKPIPGAKPKLEFWEQEISKQKLLTVPLAKVYGWLQAKREEGYAVANIVYASLGLLAKERLGEPFANSGKNNALNLHLHIHNQSGPAYRVI